MRWTQEGYLEDLVIERSAIWLDLWNEQLMKRGNVPNPKQNQLDLNGTFDISFRDLILGRKSFNDPPVFPFNRDFRVEIFFSGFFLPEPEPIVNPVRLALPKLEYIRKDSIPAPLFGPRQRFRSLNKIFFQRFITEIIMKNC